MYGNIFSPTLVQTTTRTTTTTTTVVMAALFLFLLPRPHTHRQCNKFLKQTADNARLEDTFFIVLLFIVAVFIYYRIAILLKQNNFRLKY